jgi:hypothetical protein
LLFYFLFVFCFVLYIYFLFCFLLTCCSCRSCAKRPARLPNPQLKLRQNLRSTCLPCKQKQTAFCPCYRLSCWLSHAHPCELLFCSLFRLLLSHGVRALFSFQHSKLFFCDDALLSHRHSYRDPSSSPFCGSGLSRPTSHVSF